MAVAHAAHHTPYLQSCNSTKWIDTEN